MTADSERIFLRDSETGAYYRSPNAWVSNANEATTFETRDHALHQRLLIDRRKMEMLVVDDRGRPYFGMRLWTDDE